MSIPKVIYQTYSSAKLPLYARLQIWNLKRKHKDYQHVFFDDKNVSDFIRQNFPKKIYELYSQLQIGAAKADFFRYAILYINGGIYMDLDVTITGSLNKLINSNDKAIIANERVNKVIFLQSVLIYEKKHPILKTALQIVLSNIENNKYPNNVHAMTGPTPYSKAVYHYLNNNPNDNTIRIVNTRFNGTFRHKTILARLHYLLFKNNNWKHVQKKKTVCKKNIEVTD